MLDKLFLVDDDLHSGTNTPVPIMETERRHKELMIIKENLSTLLPEIRDLYCYYKQVQKFVILYYEVNSGSANCLCTYYRLNLI